MNSAYDGWQKLCDEYAVLQKAHFDALGSLIRTFAKSGAPTAGLLDASEQAWKRIKDMKRRMDDCVKANI